MIILNACRTIRYATQAMLDCLLADVSQCAEIMTSAESALYHAIKPGQVEFWHRNQTITLRAQSRISNISTP